jgi:hypothetical protein
LKDRNAFLLCGDANQIVHPNFFSWSKVKSLFYVAEEAALAAPIHVLGVNYRSSRAVCETANVLLKVKNARFGSIDRESTALVESASDNPGRVLGLVKKDAVLRELDKRTKSSAKVAVVVMNDDKKAEARRIFSTPLVFSIHEAKGLEYESVILYDIVSTERARFSEIADGVTRADLARSELEYSRAKDKGDKSLEVYKFFVNALYVALTRAIETVYVVESDTSHTVLSLLGITCGEDVSGVETKTSSLEDWEREARRLELQGKTEQAQAIKRGILKVSPVPWPVLDHAGFRETRERALDLGYGKAKQHLFEFAAFHELRPLCLALKQRAGYAPPKTIEETATLARERAMGAYDKHDERKVYEDIQRYGIEHRNMMGMTPLMMAVDAGDVALTEALVERGARIDAVDPLGRMPIHFALRRAFLDAAFAGDKLGTLHAVLCPTAIEIETDGQRLRLARNQGEFFLLLCMVARFHELYRGIQRYRGFRTEHVSESALASFPRSVVPEDRRRRVYWNGVFARAEVDSTYRPARRLWRREQLGHYVPSNTAIRVAGETGADDRFVPLDELMAIRELDTVALPTKGQRSRDERLPGRPRKVIGS